MLKVQSTFSDDQYHLRALHEIAAVAWWQEAQHHKCHTGGGSYMSVFMTDDDVKNFVHKHNAQSIVYNEAGLANCPDERFLVTMVVNDISHFEHLFVPFSAKEWFGEVDVMLRSHRLLVQRYVC
jgi:hypothetical protein